MATSKLADLKLVVSLHLAVSVKLIKLGVGIGWL